MTTRQAFRAAMKAHDAAHAGKHWGSEASARRALCAAWWFIENVPTDDPARNDLFFKVRELVRNAS